MSEGNDAGGLNKSRLVLGDITNRVAKRGISEREKSGIKIYSLSDKDTVKHARVSLSPRQRTELDLLKGNVLSRISENNKGQDVQDLDSSPFSDRSVDIVDELTGYGNREDICGKNDVKLSEPPSINPMFAPDNVLAKFDSLEGMLEISTTVTENTSPNLTGNVKSNVVDIARNSSGDAASNVTKLSKSSYLNLFDLGRDNPFRCANSKAKIKLSDIASANTSSTVSDTGSDCLLDFANCDAREAKISLEGTQKNCDAGEAKISLEGTQKNANYLNEVERHNADNFIMSQSDSIDCAFLRDSQESRIFGADKPSETKKCKEYPCIDGGVDAIKTCSCSFCTKAAYIWLDLNYQDFKGRVSATRKSQKEAIILAERKRMVKETEEHDAEGSTRISKLEIDLMHQWKFLFQHMAGIWEQEADHLGTSLSRLTDLREKCKRDLGSK